jgi:enoyl-CoA hydratase/carnithine racemase
MHSEYRWVLAELDGLSDVRAVVVTGTPPAFCVGGDSAALAGHAERGAYDPGLAPELATPGYGVAPEFDADFAFQFAMRFPIIAAVNGAAAGVGLALALFCDLRFASAPARLTTAAPKLGLPAEYGMSWQLPRLVGVTRAADLLLSGRVFTPDETQAWGLWNSVEPDGDAALASAQQYAHHLAHGVGPTALATTKAQVYRDLLHHSPAAAIQDAQRLLEQAMTTAEYREGVSALREKRPPRFE